MPPAPAAKTPSPTAAANTPADFETAMAELERLVAGMEAGEMTLEQSLAAHKRGLELAQFCQALLARAQQQVKVLEENALRVLDEPGTEE